MASANATGPGPSSVAGSSSHSTWGCQMDALVTDLSLALDESQHLQRRRRPFRRRPANQQGKTQCGAGSVGGRGSDFSSSSAEDAAQTGGANSQDNKSSMPLTDSDEGFSPCPRTPRYRAPRPLRPPRPPPGAGMVESDSVNESFSPAPRPANLRRKPKCKRLALDPSGEACQTTPPRGPRWRAAPVLHRIHTLHTPTSRRSNMCGGKRKRSRDGRGEEEELHCVTPMDMEAESPASRGRSRGGRCGGEWSSDDSDGEREARDEEEEEHGGADLFTCDEGREADDEQSDWVTEGPGPVYGVPSTSLAGTCDDPSASVGLHSSRQRFQKIRERLLRREIRAGRRRLRERRPGYAIGPSSVSETVTRFMQDPMASELQLRPASLAECDQLQRLAQLYSLQLRVGGDEAGPGTSPPSSHPAALGHNSCFVTKTKHTVCGEATFPLLEMAPQRHTQQPGNNNIIKNNNSTFLSSSATRHLSTDLHPKCNGGVGEATLHAGAFPSTSSGGAGGGGPASPLTASSFPWVLPTPLSDATKKRRKTPSSPAMPLYPFSSPDAALLSNAVPSNADVSVAAAVDAGGAEGLFAAAAAASSAQLSPCLLPLTLKLGQSSETHSIPPTATITSTVSSMDTTTTTTDQTTVVSSSVMNYEGEVEMVG